MSDIIMDDVIEYIDENTILTTNTRIRQYVDQRHYLMGLMFYEFGFGITRIARMFNRTHATVKYATEILADRQFQTEFKTHTKDLREKFPYVFPERPERTKKVDLKFDLSLTAYGQLRKLMKKFDSNDLDDVIRKIAKELV